MFGFLRARSSQIALAPALEMIKSEPAYTAEAVLNLEKAVAANK